MKSIKIPHHPNGNADVWSDVGTELDKRSTGPTPATSTDNALARWDGATGRILQNSTIVATDAGAVSGITTLATTGAITQNGANVAVVTQTDFISGIIPSVTDRDYKIVVKLPYGMTITETTTICASGTATFTFKINTTALGGTANSVSSGEQSQAHSTNNVAAAGDDLVITASASSACLFASFNIHFTRTLA